MDPAIDYLLTHDLAALPLGGRLRRRLGSRSGLFCRRGVGKNYLKSGDLVMLGQVLEHDIKLLLVQILPGLLRSVKILSQNFNNIPGLQAEVLRQLVYFILVDNTTQYGHLQ